MKKLLMVLALTASSMAFADHSLQTAMDQSAEIKDGVEAMVKKSGLVCDLDQSMQMNPTDRNSSWRQVALCYASADVMTTANATLAEGNALGGIYGIPAAAILDVEYSQNAKTYNMDKLISITLK